MRTRRFAPAAVLAAALLGGCVAAPPPRVVYVRPPPPRCAWVPGHWRWTDDGYRLWVHGHCLPLE
jgi:hypothetical protein